MKADLLFFQEVRIKLNISVDSTYMLWFIPAPPQNIVVEQPK
jgi:hypothetical protein